MRNVIASALCVIIGCIALAVILMTSQKAADIPNPSPSPTASK